MNTCSLSQSQSLSLSCGFVMNFQFLHIMLIHESVQVKEDWKIFWRNVIIVYVQIVVLQTQNGRKFLQSFPLSRSLVFVYVINGLPWQLKTTCYHLRCNMNEIQDSCNHVCPFPAASTQKKKRNSLYMLGVIFEFVK